MAKDYVYGQHPQPFGPYPLDWSEYMHYLYLPVVMRGTDGPIGHSRAGQLAEGRGQGGLRLPRNLEFLRDVIRDVCDAEQVWGHLHHSPEPAKFYVYVTARRGYAAPGNPLNRPGWHADGFGSDDINFIWSDRWPTRFATGEFRDISTDHVQSAVQFKEQLEDSQLGPIPGLISEREGEPGMVYRLDPSVVHSTPIIPAPGGDRSFFKISLSPNRYNLLGNSHNYLFDYGWKMWSRAVVRNDPAWAGGDAGPQS